MSNDSENHDPEIVKRANGRLILGGAIVGMVLFIAAVGFIAIFGVPGGEGGTSPQQQASQQTGSQ